MNKLIKKFLDIPKIQDFPSNNSPTSLSSGQSQDKFPLTDILQKPTKSFHEAEMIYDKIRNFKCFNTFFKQNPNFDNNTMLNLCKQFTFEQVNVGEFVLKQGDVSNNKFYIVLSGEVAVIIGQKNIGQFGDDFIPYEPVKKTPKKAPKILINGSVQDTDTKRGSRVSVESRKAATVNSLQAPERNSSVSKESPGRILDCSIMERGTPFRTPPKNQRQPSPISKSEARANEPTPPRTGFGGLKKMRAMVRMVTAVNGLKKAAEPRREEGNPEYFSHKAAALMDMGPRFHATEPKRHVVTPPREQQQSRGVKKMRTIVKMFSAMRGLKKEAGERREGSSNGSNMKGEAGTLAYLDKESEESEEEEENWADIEKQKFEEYADKFGKIVRYLKEEESFGELALKNNSKRTASILCKTDCEFLVIEKQQFDVLFGQEQKDKEEFLRMVFPSLGTNITSRDNFNYLVYSFKAESYGRGQNIIAEGEVLPKNAKFYVIQQGECMLEKRFTKDLSHPYDRKKTIITTYDTIEVAVLGKGSIFGEEILDNRNSYEFSVKAISDNVLVQAITRKDFKLKFPWEFHEYIMNINDQKKNYHEAALEKFKAKSLAREEQYKKENVYCLQNVQLSTIIARPAIQVLSRQVQINSTKKITKAQSSILDHITVPTQSQGLISNVPEGVRAGLNYIENQVQIQSQSQRRASLRNEPTMFSPRWQEAPTDDEQNRKQTDKRVYARINFLNKIPDVKKPTIEPAGLHTLKNDKFFEAETRPSPRPSTQKVAKRAKIIRIDSMNNINRKSEVEPAAGKGNVEKLNLGLLQLKEHISDLTSWRSSELCISSIAPEKLKNIAFMTTAAKPNTTQSQAPITQHNSPRPTTSLSTMSKSVPKLQLGLNLKSRPQTSSSNEYAFITRLETEEKSEPMVIHSHRSEAKSRETSREASRNMRKRLFSRPATARAGPESFRDQRRASENPLLKECMVQRPLLTERASRKEDKEIGLGLHKVQQSVGDVRVLHQMMKDVKKNIKIRGLRGSTGVKVKSLVELSGTAMP